MNKKKMNNKGFSLVELIIVIAIMAILIGVLAPQFIKYVERSRVSKDMQNMQQAKTAIEVAISGNQATSGTYSISMNHTTKAVTVSVPSGVTLDGVSSFELSSGNWSADATYTYDFTKFNWGDTPASSTNQGYDMADVFK